MGMASSVMALVVGSEARILYNKEGRESTPSVVSLKRKDGSVLVGDLALDNRAMAPKDTIYSIIRIIGRHFSDEEVQKVRNEAQYEVVETEDGVCVVMGDKQYAPAQISAMILKKLREDAEYRLAEEVTDAVITVPAYFNRAQKDATRRAGQEAGLKILKVMDEPEALAIAHGMDNIKADAARYILVYDLGKYRFDASVLMRVGKGFVPIALSGNVWLGGDTFDAVIVDHVLRYIKREYAVDPQSNLPFMHMLYQEARAAKERLSSTSETDIILAGGLTDENGSIVDIQMEITRSEFEALIRHIMEKTIGTIDELLNDAGVSPDDIGCVIMAGKSTCVPLVQLEVARKFGAERVRLDISPQLSVAKGAAQYAASLDGKVVCQAQVADDPYRECGHHNSNYSTECERCGAALGTEDFVDEDLDYKG